MTYRWENLTPFFCGDADGKTTHAKTTTLVGSLRWWYEALLRALNVYACDPTKQGCEGPSLSRPHGSYCAACAVFGCTGRSKRIGVRLEKGITFALPGKAGQRGLSIKPNKPRRKTGWYLKPGLLDNLQLSVSNVDPLNPTADRLLPVLVLASRWAALGARVQHGYGVGELFQGIQPVTLDKESVVCLVRSITNSFQGQKISKNDDAWPDLRHFFFAKFLIKAKDDSWIDRFKNSLDLRQDGPAFDQWVESGSVPVSPAVRNVLRDKTWKPASLSSKEAENRLFGALHLERRATRIAISHAYRTDTAEDNGWHGEIRLFGWVPFADGYLRSRGISSRDTLMRQIHSTLVNPAFWEAALGSRIIPTRSDGNCQHEWREFKSPRERDTIGKFTDVKDYIVSLVC